jgi:hypothetical protein
MSQLFNIENIKIDNNGLMDINNFDNLIDYIDNVIRKNEKFDEEFEYNASCGGSAPEFKIERDLDLELSNAIWDFYLIINKLDKSSTQYYHAHKRIDKFIELSSKKLSMYTDYSVNYNLEKVINENVFKNSLEELKSDNLNNIVNGSYSLLIRLEPLISRLNLINTIGKIVTKLR